MDPMTIALLASTAMNTISGLSNKRQQQQGLDFQMQNLANTLHEARVNEAQRLGVAGAPRYDQFGNMTAYDPVQGRWITTFTPQQQRLISEGQNQQERALARAAQASEDYQQQRAGYLYKQPETEAAIRAEILNLMQTARGEGDRALMNLVQRQELRQKGNLPVIYSGVNINPAPGERLAQAMLQARGAAQTEHEARVRAHQSEYLPALAAFERTANYQAPESPVGRGIIGMGAQGAQDILSALGDYGKLSANIYGTGGKGVESAYTNINKAAATDASTGSNALNNLIKVMSQQQKAAGKATPEGTVGDTTGATYSGSPSAGGPSVPYLSAGGESAPIGINYGPPLGSGGNDPFAVGGYAVSTYNDPFSNQPGSSFAMGTYSNPWQF
jgi:hypothetical protein